MVRPHLQGGDGGSGSVAAVTVVTVGDVGELAGRAAVLGALRCGLRDAVIEG